TVIGIVEQSGGRVTVSSEPGFGTTFKVFLPVTTREPVVRAYRPAERPGGLAGTETILVCEDDDLVRTFIEVTLTDQGYTVFATPGPDEALEFAATHTGPIDILLSDVIMPHLSGPDLAGRLTAGRPGIKVIFVSGYAADAKRDGPGFPAGSV